MTLDTRKAGLIMFALLLFVLCQSLTLFVMLLKDTYRVYRILKKDNSGIFFKRHYTWNDIVRVSDQLVLLSGFGL